MNNISISQYYNEGNRGRGADVLRFWLMPFMCFMLFGFSEGDFGGVVATLSRFVAPASFILCGFFVLCPDRDERRRKLIRAIRRSGIFFLILLAVYFGINLIYYAVNGIDWTPEVFRAKTAFNFFVLNLWPLSMGDSIWFIQSLFFAYVIIWIADSLKLYKVYKLILIVLLAFMLLSGEFASLVNLHLFGYAYIPGGTVTRALPYLLLGMLIRQHAGFFLDIKHRWRYLVLFVIGLVLAYVEMEILYQTGYLIYNGHLVGLGIAAFAICLFALTDPMHDRSFTSVHGRRYARRIYALCQPVAFGVLLLAESIAGDVGNFMVAYRGIIVYVICFILAFLIGLLRRLVIARVKPDALKSGDGGEKDPELKKEEISSDKA